MPGAPSPCINCPRFPPDPKPDGIEDPSSAGIAPPVANAKAAVKNSIFFIDIFLHLRTKDGSRVGEDTGQTGNRLVMGGC